LLSNAERAFAAALEAALPPGARLLAKVRIADMIKPANASDRPAFFRISQKHLDFVVTTRDWKPLAAIELNDRSHDSARRRARDEFLRQAFAAAGVPLHFVRAAARYDGMPSSAIGRRRCPKIPGAIGIARPSSRKEANDRRTAHHFTLPCSGYVIRPPPWVASATSRPERPALLPRRARVAGHHRPWPTDGRTQRANGSCPTGRRLKGLHTRRFRCSASLLR
jgi:hypothetical protein